MIGPFTAIPRGIYRAPPCSMGGIISLGVVFKLTPQGIESVSHTFMGGSDGAHPKGSCIADSEETSTAPPLRARA